MRSTRLRICFAASLIVCASSAHSTQLLLNNYMATLNAALRHVAASDGIPLVDFEALALQLPAAHCIWATGCTRRAARGGLMSKVTMDLMLNDYDRHSSGAAAV